MVEKVDAPVTPKKAKTPKVKKPKVAPSHPPVAEMVTSAVSTLKERGGSSLAAIKKYIASNYKVDVDKLSPFIRKYIKSAVTSGGLVQTKGKGANGSFRIGGSTKPKAAGASKPKSAAVKAAKPKKARSASPKKAAAKPKKVAAAKPKKSPAAKKPKAAKKAASPKKPKAVKAAKPKKAKASPKKKAAPKKAKK